MSEKTVSVSSRNLEQAVEDYERMRNERLAAQQAIDLAYQKELLLKDGIINLLRDQLGETNEDGEPTELAFMSGWCVKLVKSSEPFIQDFTALSEYIRKEGAIDLLQKRLTPNAVKLRWKDGLTVPGVGTSTKFDIKVYQGE